MENLSQLRTGQHMEIIEIPRSHPLRIPLEQFGIVPGSILFCRYCSPGRELLALECEGGVVALRASELCGITGRSCS